MKVRNSRMPGGPWLKRILSPMNLLFIAAACANAAEPWWKDAVIYEIYPRSFADTNGDGIGDLNGITAHLDYLKNLGVDAIWIGPLYPSPLVDFGYDVADYQNVAPEYGALADFDRLAAEAKKRNHPCADRSGSESHVQPESVVFGIEIVQNKPESRLVRVA